MIAWIVTFAAVIARYIGRLEDNFHTNIHRRNRSIPPHTDENISYLHAHNRPSFTSIHRRDHSILYLTSIHTTKPEAPHSNPYYSSKHTRQKHTYFHDTLTNILCIKIHKRTCTHDTEIVYSLFSHHYRKRNCDTVPSPPPTQHTPPHNPHPTPHTPPTTQNVTHAVLRIHNHSGQPNTLDVSI